VEKDCAVLAGDRGNQGVGKGEPENGLEVAGKQDCGLVGISKVPPPASA
jgi:hypothetical protein